MWALARSPDPDLALRAPSGSRRLDARRWTDVRRRAARASVGLRGGCSPCSAARPRSATTSSLHPDRWRRLLRRRRRPRRGRRHERTSALLAAVGAEPDAPPAGSPGAGSRARLTGTAAVDGPAHRLPRRDARARRRRPRRRQRADAAGAAARGRRRAARGPRRRGPAGGARRRASPRPSTTTAVTRGRLAVIAMGKCGGARAELRQRRRRRVRRGARRRRHHPARGPDDAHRWARRASRSTPTCAPRAGRARWSARSTATSPTTSGGPRPGSSRRCSRPARSPATPSWARPTPRPSRRWCGARRGPAGLRRRRAGHAPPRRGARPPRPRRPRDQARPRRAARRRVRRAAAAARARPRRRGAALAGRRSTRCAALADGGYVGRDDGANLAASYRFLRLLEHRLQLQRLRRTHLLPAADDTDALRWLARVGEAAARRPPRRRRRAHRGVAPQRPAGAPAAREAVLPAAARRGVAGVGRPARLSARRPPPGSGRWAGRRRRARWGTCGRSPAGSPAPRRSSGPCCPCCSTSSPAAPIRTAGCWPTGGCPRRSADTPWYLRLLRDEGLVAQRLMRLLGTSALVPDLLVRAPEVLRLLAAPTAGPRRRAAARPGGRRRVAAAHGRRARPTRTAAATARSLRRHELLRVACADLLGMLSTSSRCAPRCPRCGSRCSRPRWNRCSGR